jgi:hypothetical protein
MLTKTDHTYGGDKHIKGRRERALDEGLMETFPASDAVTVIQPVPEQRKLRLRRRD